MHVHIWYSTAQMFIDYSLEPDLWFSVLSSWKPRGLRLDSSFELFNILLSQVWRFLRWEIKRFLAWLTFHTSRSFFPHVYFRRWRCIVVGAAMGASSLNFFLKNFIQAGFTVPSVISQINLTVLSCNLLFTWCLLGAEALVSCGLLEALLRVVEHQGGDSHLTVRWSQRIKFMC